MKIRISREIVSISFSRVIRTNEKFTRNEHRLTLRNLSTTERHITCSDRYSSHLECIQLQRSRSLLMFAIKYEQTTLEYKINRDVMKRMLSVERIKISE